MAYASPEQAREYRRKNREKLRVQTANYYARNKEKRKAASAANYAANRERIKARQTFYRASKRQENRTYAKRYYASNWGKIKARQAAYYSANRERLLISGRGYQKGSLSVRRAYQKRRRMTDPDYRLMLNLRSRIHQALKRGYKVTSTRLLLGCTIPELRAHLEQQFRPGMTWENYGPVWHIDHKKPCAKFDLSDAGQQKACFHYSNLQPLFAQENLRKGDTYAD